MIDDRYTTCPCCLLGTVSPVDNPLLCCGTVLRLTFCAVFPQRKTASIYFGAIRRQRFTILVFALGGLLTVPRIRDTPLTFSQDETLIRPFISRLLAWAWRLPRRRVFGFPNLFQYDSGLSARRGEVFAMKLPWRCAVYLFQGCD